MKRAVLVGTDFMYRQDGKLVPIEINTNVGWDSENRLELISDMFDFSMLREFILQNGIKHLYLEGYLMQIDLLQREFKKNLEDLVTLEFVMFGDSIEEGEDSLYIRTSFSETALLDSYAANKLSFKKLIAAETFGSEEFICGDEGKITECPDNGNYPNFIVKSIYPSYDKNHYPRLFNFSNVQDVQEFASNLTSGELIEPYDYNENSVCECLGEGRIRLFRNWSVIVSEEDRLTSITIGNYEKVSSNVLKAETDIRYQETHEIVPEDRSMFLVGTLSNEKMIIFAEGTDEIQMEDGTWKQVDDLSVGDHVRSVKIPSSGSFIPSREEDYNISYDEFVSGSRFVSSSILEIYKGTYIIDSVELQFTDGTSWEDQGESSYLSIDPEDGTVRFSRLINLEEGTEIILLEASTGEYVRKVVKSKTTCRKFVEGYSLTASLPHTLIFREAGENSAYYSIEHNENIGCAQGQTRDCVSKKNGGGIDFYGIIDFEVDPGYSLNYFNLSGHVDVYTSYDGCDYQVDVSCFDLSQYRSCNFGLRKTSVGQLMLQANFTLGCPGGFYPQVNISCYDGYGSWFYQSFSGNNYYFSDSVYIDADNVKNANGDILLSIQPM